MSHRLQCWQDKHVLLIQLGSGEVAGLGIWGSAPCPGCKERRSPITLCLHLVQGGGLVEFILDGQNLQWGREVWCPLLCPHRLQLAGPGPRPWLMCQTVVCSPLRPSQPLAFAVYSFLPLYPHIPPHPQLLPRSVQEAHLYITHRVVRWSVVAYMPRPRPWSLHFLSWQVGLLPQLVSTQWTRLEQWTPERVAPISQTPCSWMAIWEGPSVRIWLLCCVLFCFGSAHLFRGSWLGRGRKWGPWRACLNESAAWLRPVTAAWAPQCLGCRRIRRGTCWCALFCVSSSVPHSHPRHCPLLEGVSKSASCSSRKKSVGPWDWQSS